MFSSLFEFLFKYPLADFRQGEFELAYTWLTYAAVVVLILLLTLLIYQWVRSKTALVDRVVLALLRTLLLAVIVFSLLQPVLLLSNEVPQRSVVGVLLDDSRSMRIDDLDGQTRAQFATDGFRNGQDNLLARLSEQFEVRLFRFASRAEAIDNVAELDFAGGRTDLGKALQDAQQTLSGLPLAGLVVLSDGADNAGTALSEPLLALRAGSVPVYAVGVGRENFDKDIEISRVQMPLKVLNGSTMLADLNIRQRGYAGRKVPVIVESAGRILHQEEIELPADGEIMPLQLQFTLDEPGPRQLLFRIPLQDDEKITLNNDQEVVTLVADRREKILYVEGEPRFELKFIRRAVKDDENLQVASLLRTAENKYYRLGIDDPDELVDGFPQTAEELFAYRGLILGNVEASFFSREQMQMIVDYVSERGGGLLLLGGSKAFAEGGYTDTPLADIIPVQLETRADSGFAREVSVRPTMVGNSHPVTRLAGDEQTSLGRWNTLPPLTAVNPIYQAKPGAALLLNGVDGSSGRPSVILATQRYGSGRVIAFAVQNSWLWQMHHDIALEDQTHETLWRQLLRWLVSSVPQRLEVTLPGGRVAPGDVLTLSAEFRSKSYQPAGDAEVRALITSPTGIEQEVMLPRSTDPDQDGVYSEAFVAQEEGLHELNIRAYEGDELVSESEGYITVAEQAHEYLGAEMQAGLLQRIAAETGGKFYQAADSDGVVADIQPVQSGTTVLEQRELWDMPVLFLLIILLLAAEWSYRRWRGLI